VKKRVSWKGAAVQIGLESGSRGKPLLEAVTRQLLVKTMRAGKYLACARIIGKVWISAMAL
jgi:hypothetical protein